MLRLSQDAVLLVFPRKVEICSPVEKTQIIVDVKLDDVNLCDVY